MAQLRLPLNSSQIRFGLKKFLNVSMIFRSVQKTAPLPQAVSSYKFVGTGWILVSRVGRVVGWIFKKPQGLAPPRWKQKKKKEKENPKFQTLHFSLLFNLPLFLTPHGAHSTRLYPRRLQHSEGVDLASGAEIEGRDADLCEDSNREDHHVGGGELGYHRQCEGQYSG